MSTTIPEPPLVPGHWLLGNARDWKSGGGRDYLAKVSVAAGGMARVRLLHRQWIPLTRPDYLRHVLITNKENYQRTGLYKSLEQVFGPSLATLRGKPWRARRRLAMPSFQPQLLDRAATAAIWAANRLARRWEIKAAAGRPVRTIAELRRATLESNCRNLFTSELTDQEAEMLLEAGTSTLWCFEENAKSLTSLLFDRVPPAGAQMRRAHRLLKEVVQLRVDERLAPGAREHDDVLQDMLQRLQSEVKSTSEMRDILTCEISGLVVLGSETSAESLAWALYHLNRQPILQQRWHDEIDAVLGRRPIGLKDLAAMPLTAAIIQEALRLKSPAPGVPRVALREDVIDGYRIRPGVIIYCCFSGAHMNPTIWGENVQAFDPDRFVVNDPRLRDCSWLPFGAGPHVCVGNTVALNALRFILLAIGQRFCISINDSVERTPAQLGGSDGNMYDFDLHLTPR